MNPSPSGILCNVE